MGKHAMLDLSLHVTWNNLCQADHKWQHATGIMTVNAKVEIKVHINYLTRTHREQRRDTRGEIVKK